MAQIKKPNTICRNPNCTKGEDGGRKHYYSCMTCLRKESWRSYCCSVECYENYTQMVLDKRAQAKAKGEELVPEIPERTDMSAQEIMEVMEQPIEEVVEYTETVEIPDYIEENQGASLSEIIDIINEDIDVATNKKSRRKNK